MIYIKFDDKLVGKKQINSDNYAKQHNCVPIERFATDIEICKSKPSSPVIKRTQFPLMIAWACTVHKVQGNQFRQIVVSFELNKQRSFNPWQMYVALSRVTSLDGLFLIGNYNANAIKIDDRVTEEYDRMRRECTLLPIENLGPSQPQQLLLTLLNVRSLQKHCIDVVSDIYLMRSDILCLTETQIYEQQDTTDITAMFPEYNMMYSKDTHKYSSLAFCSRKELSITGSKAVPSAFLVSFRKDFVIFY